MRDKWYGDNRDLVKWGVLLTLAERFEVQQILQVLYYRPTHWAGLELDGEKVDLPPAVIQHFRQVTAASAIQSSATIDVFANPFTNRERYLRDVIERILSRPPTRGIVFLDPDTGLEPQNPNLNHVLNQEVAAVWDTLRAGDFLVFYQHQTNRNGDPWIEPKKEQFEHAIGVPIGSAKLARSEQIARDVVLFYAQKPG
jgi:hypothetical protein